MATNDLIHEGGCACGAVRFTAGGEPRRGGLCHCMICRKAHSSVFNFFLLFDHSQVEIRGDLVSWNSSPNYVRSFCARCGSRICGVDEKEIELSAGSFDEAGLFEPQYEIWVKRREPWVAALDVPQYPENRT